MPLRSLYFSVPCIKRINVISVAWLNQLSFLWEWRLLDVPRALGLEVHI